jgi:exosortase E/protease (VPEID-CTERM system)
MNRRGSQSVPSFSHDAASRSVLTRLQWLLVLGTVEFLALSMWLDTDRITATGVWRLVLKKLPDGVLFGLVAVGLALLLGGLTSWSRLREEIDRRRIVTSFPWIWYVPHLCALAGFVVLSRRMIAAESSGAIGEAWWPAVWVACGLAACLLWLAGLLPVALWRPALSNGARGLLAAIPVTVAAWAIARVTRDSWRSLAEPTLNAVLLLLRLFGETPVHHPATYGVTLDTFSVQIDPSCSGYQGFGVMAVFSAAYVWAFRSRLRFPQALLLVPLAIAASLVGNVVRIAVLLLIGARYSPAIALGGFHSQAGWLFLIVVSVLVVGVAQRLPWFTRDVPRAIDLRRSAVAACLMPFLIWHVLGLASRLFVADPSQDPFYPVRVLALLIPVWYWRGLYARLLAANALSLAGLITGAAAFALWMLLEAWIPAVPSADAPPLVPDAVAHDWQRVWLALRVLGYCLAAPIVEELAFRGYLMRRFQAFRFDEIPFARTAWPGMLISSLLFGALHGERWLAGAAVGLIYALTVRYTGRLSSGLLAHVATNVLVTAYVLATGDTARWH